MTTLRILCTTHPGSGHLHPLVPLARALQAAGHEVKVAAAASFGPAIEAAGLEAVPAGVDWLQSESEAAMPGFMAADGPRQLRMLVDLATQGMVDDVIAIGEAWQPDLILRDAMEYGGWVAAERLGVVHASYGIGMRIPPPIVRMWTGDQLTGLPRAYGLRADPALSRMSRHLNFNPVPKSFELTAMDGLTALVKSFEAVDGLTPARFLRTVARAAVSPKGVPNSVRIQPLLFDRSGPEDVPDRVRDLPPGPTVYATLGTVFNRQPRVLEAILGAFADGRVNLILTVGRNADPETFGPQPANVAVERYIPQSAVLPRCDAVITHGGYNTIMAALSRGLPVCCLPFAADQPINTRRAVRLGAGVSCANATPDSSPFPIVDPSALRPDAIRAAVDRVLHDPQYRRAAEGLRDEIRALPGVDVAVDAIERLAWHAAPVAVAA
jgi:UDP:flavonoid glycosyltransferase YjiC (YdhE family)